MLPAPAYLGRKARERMVTLPTRGSDRQREIEPKKKKRVIHKDDEEGIKK